MLPSPICCQTKPPTAAQQPIPQPREHATHGRPQAALLLGGRGQPPLLRLREGFSDEEKGEEASAEGGIAVQGERVGDGCHGWSAQGALSRPVLPSRRHSGVGQACAPLPARGFAAQVLYHYLGGVSLIDMTS